MDIARKLFQNMAYDALIVLSPSNTFYLSGYESSNCQIVITKTNQYFVTDMRYFNEASLVLGGRFVVVASNGEGEKQLFDIAQKDGCIAKIGWDDNISYNEFLAVYDTAKKFADIKEFSPIAKQISAARNIKNADEIAKIRKAQAITEIAFDEILKFIKEGQSEIEIAAMLEYIMLKNGGELAFDSIVACGKNGSSPHAHRSEKKLVSGEFITMDFGAKYQGYCSDMTRTVACGQLSDKQIDIYNTVLLAQQTALDNIKAGMVGKDCHQIANKVIQDKGYGEYFLHSLGHGVGVDIHEGVGMTPKTADKLECNMIVSVEPGIYIEGFCGVRIEDIVVVHDTCVEDLTQSNKKLIIL